MNQDKELEMKELVKKQRAFLKHLSFEGYQQLQSDQQKEIKPPELEKLCPKSSKLVDLVTQKEFKVGNVQLLETINKRISRRKYTKEALTLEELSFLLWVTQGVKEIPTGRVNTKRTVPSGGARHPFETYLWVNRVKGLEQGIYRYQATHHRLCYFGNLPDNAEELLTEATYNQRFIAKSAVVFIWSAVPYRAEWRYIVWAHKAILLDAGHVCQNLYLGCEAINAGTCAIAAYDQEKIDKLLKLDGEEEFTIYLAPVGKV